MVAFRMEEDWKFPWISESHQVGFAWEEFNIKYFESRNLLSSNW